MTRVFYENGPYQELSCMHYNRRNRSCRLRKCPLNRPTMIVNVLCAMVVALVMSFILMKRSYDSLLTLANSSFPDTFWHMKDSYPLPRPQPVLNLNSSILKNSSAIFTICARDVAKFLPKLRRNVERIAAVFRDYRILVGESDSSDNTVVLVQKWAVENRKVLLHTYGNLSKAYLLSRTERIAFCRNQLLKTARDKNWLFEARYLLVMDADINANNILTIENFLSNFEYDVDSWAAMTASQTLMYYDVWALRSTTANYDCWAMVRQHYHVDIATKIYVAVHMQPIPRDFGLIHVQSAFGGFAIYQTRFLNNCWYRGSEGSNRDVCEHLSLHLCITNNGGNIFINPKFQNADGLKN